MCFQGTNTDKPLHEIKLFAPSQNTRYLLCGGETKLRTNDFDSNFPEYNRNVPFFTENTIPKIILCPKAGFLSLQMETSVVRHLKSFIDLTNKTEVVANPLDLWSILYIMESSLICPLIVEWIFYH